MLHFSQEFSQTLHSLRVLDEIGVKTASAEATVMAEEGVIRGSNALYEVLTKTASEEFPKTEQRYSQIDLLVQKMAALLGKETPTADTRAKIASAVVIDDLLSGFLKTEPLKEHLKLAETRSYGREFLMDLLRTVL
jgi:hypothetical protein